ncbi:MAG: tetratricopeptide repeat protein [Alphaproteobacteria bacterium]|nr:tetratricopeptide repeat protein [Alphaproteobacteria bacterium]
MQLNFLRKGLIYLIFSLLSVPFLNAQTTIITGKINVLSLKNNSKTKLINLSQLSVQADPYNITKINADGRFELKLNDNYSLGDNMSIYINQPFQNEQFLILDSFELKNFKLKPKHYLTINLVKKSEFIEIQNDIESKIKKNKIRFNDSLIKLLQDSLGIYGSAKIPNNTVLKNTYNRITNLYDETQKMTDYITLISKVYTVLKFKNNNQELSKYIDFFLEGDWSLIIKDIDFKPIYDNLNDAVNSQNKISNQNSKDAKLIQLNATSLESKINTYKELILLKIRTEILSNDFINGQQEYEKFILLDSNNFLVMIEFLELEQKLNIFKDKDFFLEVLAKIFKESALEDPLNNGDDYSKTLFNIGKIYADEGKYDKAKLYFNLCIQNEQTTPALKNAPNFESNLALLYQALGEVYLSENDTNKSENYFQKALIIKKFVAEINSSFESKYQLTDLLIKIAALDEKKGDFIKAEDYYLEALAIIKAIWQQSPEISYIFLINNLAKLANVELQIGNFTKAIAYYKENINLNYQLLQAQEKNASPELVYSLNNLGLIYASQNQVDSAKNYFNQALSNIENLNTFYPDVFVNDKIKVLTNLGDLNFQNNSYKEAISFYQEALNSLKLKSDKNIDSVNLYFKQFNLYKQLGVTYFEIEQYDSCKQFLNLCLLIWQSLPKNNAEYNFEYSNLLSALFSLNFHENNFNEAKINLLECLQIREKSALNDKGIEPSLLWIYLQLSNVYSRLKDYQNTVYYTQKCVNYYEMNNNNGVFNELLSNLYGNLGFYYSFVTKFDSAEYYSQLGLTMSPENDWIITNLVTAKLFLGKFKESFKIYKMYADKKPLNRNEYFRDIFLKDLDSFKTSGVIPNFFLKDVAKVERYLIKLKLN